MERTSSAGKGQPERLHLLKANWFPLAQVTPPCRDAAGGLPPRTPTDCDARSFGDVASKLQERGEPCGTLDQDRALDGCDEDLIACWKLVVLLFLCFAFAAVFGRPQRRRWRRYWRARPELLRKSCQRLRHYCMCLIYYKCCDVLRAYAAAAAAVVARETRGNAQATLLLR